VLDVAHSASAAWWMISNNADPVDLNSLTTVGEIIHYQCLDGSSDMAFCLEQPPSFLAISKN
jgi:hypothetical protein